jgi:hypothetical protein
MKRAIIWVDVQDEDCQKFLEKLKKEWDKQGIVHKVVDVCDIFETGDTQ